MAVYTPDKIPGPRGPVAQPTTAQTPARTTAQNPVREALAASLASEPLYADHVRKISLLDMDGQDLGVLEVKTVSTALNPTTYAVRAVVLESQEQVFFFSSSGAVYDLLGQILQVVAEYGPEDAAAPEPVLAYVRASKRKSRAGQWYATLGVPE